MKILPRKHFKPRPEINPETTNPTLKFEMLEGSEIGISVSWPPGTDLAGFSQMLIWLFNGDLTTSTMKEMQNYATSISEADKAIGSQITIMQGIGKSKKPNSVVVSPRKAIKYNMRLHYA
jgi:hypothetical protein